MVQRKFGPEDWLRLVRQLPGLSTFSAPAPIRMVCGLPAEVKARYDRSSMKRMIANAAPWSFALKQQYLADFPADSLWEVYGSTELGVDCVLEPQDQLRKPGSCGKPAPGVEIRLLDEAGAEVTGTGPDHAGELYVRSDGVFDEYYKQPDSYDSARLGDFHTVGDIAYRDDEGYYFICDRKTDMIITGGMNVYPAEVEAALEQHPAIYEAAVFGIPSRTGARRCTPRSCSAPGASLSARTSWPTAASTWPGYKTPRSVCSPANCPEPARARSSSARSAPRTGPAAAPETRGTWPSLTHVIAEILPPPVAAVEAFDDPPGATLFPEEEAAMARAVAKRRGEFTAGRACARAALAGLGLPATAIVPGQRGAPQWPPGVVGSITHCDGYRAAAVRPRRDVLTLGIDAEPTAAARRRAGRRRTRRGERAGCRAGRGRPEVRWDRLLFCAKEAVYKAWFPLPPPLARLRGGRDRAFAPDAGSFTARLLVPGPAVGGRPLDGFSGRWLARGGLLLAAIALPA